MCNNYSHYQTGLLLKLLKALLTPYHEVFCYLHFSLVFSIDNTMFASAGLSGIAINDGNWHLVTLVCDNSIYKTTLGTLYLDFVKSDYEFWDDYCSYLYG